MIDLYLLCADLRNGQSAFKQKSNHIVSEIYTFFNNPSVKTKKVIDGWKQDFVYIYGDIDTNLSSNSKLNKGRLLNDYGIIVKDGDNCAEELQALFFSIQTFYSILIKYIMKSVLQGHQNNSFFSYEDIILGNFAKHFGIVNYCSADWYCWPVFELENGFATIMDTISACVENYMSPTTIADFQTNNNYDYIKQIYEAVIPKELRHALGEYYTPDWLADYTLKSAIGTGNIDNIISASVIDPTCGSGTFLFKTIILKRRYGASLHDIVRTVRGIDINPLAVLTAKTNYLLSVLDLVDGTFEISIPVFNADIIKLGNKETLEREETRQSFIETDNPSDVIRFNAKKDSLSAEEISPSDIVVGNPPWVNWEYMPEKYRRDSQYLWIKYNLFNAKGRDLSFSKEDISVLITYVVMDKMLKNNGVIGYVIRQGVFKSAQNGVGFRSFILRGEIPIKVEKVEDLSKIRAFENATNSTALFFAKKGQENKYPVSYYFWQKRVDIKKISFNAYSPLQEVMSQITISELCAFPAVKDDPSSLWITTDKDSLNYMKEVLGTNDYRARTGVFTGGANAVYWLQINSSIGDNISITNIVERAKRKAEQVTSVIEPDYIFPMIKGSNVSKWNTCYDTYLLCPHTVETKMWPVPQESLSKLAPKTLKYLIHFKPELDGRNGFAGWEKEIQKQEFHAILRVGDYTFSKYKVIWKYIATEFICAVVSSVSDPFLGEKLLIPNEKIMYISTDSEQEAYYLCGVLSSTLIAECVKSYMNPTSISAHVLNKLFIPAFDEGNPTHSRISALCKAGHGKADISSYIREIDRLVMEMYKVIIDDTRF